MSVEFFLYASVLPILAMAFVGFVLSVEAFLAPESEIRHPGILLAGLLLFFSAWVLFVCSCELSKRLCWEREAREAVAAEAKEGK